MVIHKVENEFEKQYNLSNHGQVAIGKAAKNDAISCEFHFSFEI
jgi:hypothetical protein